jgi:hypothetical protein
VKCAVSVKPFDVLWHVPKIRGLTSPSSGVVFQHWTSFSKSSYLHFKFQRDYFPGCFPNKLYGVLFFIPSKISIYFLYHPEIGLSKLQDAVLLSPRVGFVQPPVPFHSPKYVLMPHSAPWTNEHACTHPPPHTHTHEVTYLVKKTSQECLLNIMCNFSIDFTRAPNKQQRLKPLKTSSSIYSKGII